ncbi:hypothetical protein ACFSM5_12230 [Lacibacterium aquatile]|uniref:DUF4426 domain-containing protein n=1 Tax=Lacibacterium aquatile TaxID=1168082 RepID=A0ABW5DSN1_9PROT
MRFLAKLALAAGLATSLVTPASARVFDYEYRGDFCINFIESLFLGRDEQIAELIRDNAKISAAAAAGAATQAQATSRQIRGVTEGAPVRNIILVRDGEFTLLNQRHYLVEAGNSLYLFYCFVRNMDGKTHLIQYEATDHPQAFAAFFPKGW